MKRTIIKFEFLFGLGILQKAIVIVLISFVGFSIFSQNKDIDLLRQINVNRNAKLDPTFQIITHSVTPVSLSVPLITFSIGLLKKDSVLKQKGIYLGEAFLVNAFITTALKLSIRRDRPFVTYPDIVKLSDAGSFSFPSGHTSTAFNAATSLSIAFPKWYVIAPSFIWASAAGYSRMHLGVHYPSDVLAGVIVGSGSAYLAYKLNKWLLKKRDKKHL